MKDTHRVAIMTWYTYQNFGSVLQATALYHVVQGMGYETFFVKYPPKNSISINPQINILKQCVNKIKSMRNTLYTSAERSKLFSNYLDERTSCTTLCVSYPELHDLNDQYDAFICGSDQIWSPICYDSKYFLDFVEETDKMIAYAPSIGSTKIENAVIRNQMTLNIRRFKHLAVREQQGANLIKEITGQNAKVVLDPTLLMNASEWDSYVETDKSQKVVDDKYILCYFLGEAEKYMGYVRALSKRMNIPFYIIPVTTQQKQDDNVVPFEVGPKEFVSLIRNAVYVCTDSFHGMAFSVNYNIPFSIFKRFSDNDPKNQNSRIFNLINLLSLQDRLTGYEKKFAKLTTLSCDFTEANRHLEGLRKESIAYLQKALYSAVSAESNNNKTNSYKITNMCCGCGACASVCAKNAISIMKNEEGFEHYSIDTSKCAHCGQCKTVCPMTNIIAPNMERAKALYSVKSKSEQVLRASSSGGVGYEIAATMLNQNYAICGCTYDASDNSAKHIWIMPGEKDKLSLLQGSKYIQSVSAGALKKIVDITKTNNIAFFGTPCQAAAVDKLLCKKGLRKNAIIVDLICHGVPSYFLWDKYLKEIDIKYNTGKHPIVWFRSKEREWRRRLLLVQGNRHIYKQEEHKDDFYAFFRRGLCDMESCSDCPYRERSAADLRIGDYWGNRFKNDQQGVSMVIANTQNGERIIKDFKQNNVCEVGLHSLSEYWSVQYPYNSHRPLIREQLIEDLKNDNNTVHSLRKVYCKYYDRNEKQRKIINAVKSIIKGR